ncbi:MAG: CpsB/CapC family capsule biosynthesis tyrosine phosphatase [Cytophagales bacterium]|nr:capsular biosynthesis protein [Bernardetiaceae bacterium]MDW8210171.1 CpsB/CapC family capsule biosynthesis tyrosine phosphatase [Cytophagales bacterium]
MISLLRIKKATYGTITPIVIDMHSHLLPGIDDGVQSFEQALDILRQFEQLGYKKLIITPHVMSDYYRNTPEIIFRKLDQLSDIAQQVGIKISLEAAAEYYLDEFFVRKLEMGESLMTFGKKYLLFETSFINYSPYMEHAIFLMQSNGYRPVLAHPERYAYLYNKFETLEKWHARGVLIQINSGSLAGYYGPQAKQMAERLVEEKMVSFIGSDCHHYGHLEVHLKARKTENYIKALGMNTILNNSL